MKHLFLIGMLFSLVIDGYAQYWSDYSAYWIYSAPFMSSYGDVRVMYEKDTIIGGMNCQVLKKDMIGYSYEYKYYWYQVIGHEVTYTKYNSGVTYILNNNQFDTLYYFSGKINDRYKITDRLKRHETDSGYAVIKDTGSVIINTHKLKWQAVDYNFKVSYGNYTLRDTIIETIGATKYYFLPWDIINLDLDANQGGSLKCYHDWMLGVYPGNQDCIFDLNLVSHKRYQPFISESKQWRYVEEMYITAGSSGAHYGVSSVYFKGDSIVDHIKYSKLYRKSEQPIQGKGYLAYLMREDTVEQKVYVYDPHFNQAALLFDFKLNEGDVFNIYILSSLYSKHTVVKVDTITVFNKKLKRIEFDDSRIWVEGIGCVTGSFIPSDGELICVRENNDILYLNPKYNNCDTIFTQGPWDNIQTINGNEVMVFPNPIVSTSVVRVQSNSHEPLKIEIYNYSGALVKEDNFTGDYPIGSIGLEKGLYVYRILLGNKVINMDKIVVINE